MIELAVLGNPIAHSRSPDIHHLFAKQFNLAINYQKREVPLDAFAQVVRELQAKNLKGCNVTVPFKADAYRICDVVTAEAEALGVVNTLIFRDQQVLGDNTDGRGLILDLVEHLGVVLAGSRVLLLGIGGAARGVVPALLACEPECLHIWNRTEAVAQAYAADMGGVVSARRPSELLAGYDLVINATAAGLRGAVPELPPQIIDHHTFCYDLSYSPRLTPFLTWAETCGATLLADGLGMLVAQAAFSFEVWFDVFPRVLPVLSHLKEK